MLNNMERSVKVYHIIYNLQSNFLIFLMGSFSILGILFWFIHLKHVEALHNTGRDTKTKRKRHFTQTKHQRQMTEKEGKRNRRREESSVKMGGKWNGSN